MEELEFDEFDEVEVTSKVDLKVEEELKALALTYNKTRVERLALDKESTKLKKVEESTKEMIAELFPKLGKSRFSHAGVMVSSADKEEQVIGLKPLLRMVSGIKAGKITLTDEDIETLEEYVKVTKGNVEKGFTKQEVNEMTVVNKLGKKLDIKAK
jgi:ABC-type branched-subunit amino acid transport system ATPase component